MGCIKTILTTSAALACLGGVALAADMPGYQPPVITQGSVVPEEIGTGWYLRGDVGYARDVAPKMSGQLTDGTNRSYSGVKGSDAGTFGLGFGYKLNEWMRSDVTFDYLTPYRTKGRLSSTEFDSVRLQSFTMMANAYADLGNYSGITPYVGGGVGVASIHTDALNRDVTNVGAYSFDAAQRWSLAAAAMAGFSIDLGHGIQSDFGYKYLWVDRTHTGAETTGTYPGSVTVKDITSHQFRVGLRYFVN